MLAASFKPSRIGTGTSFSAFIPIIFLASFFEWDPLAKNLSGCIPAHLNAPTRIIVFPDFTVNITARHAYFPAKLMEQGGRAVRGEDCSCLHGGALRRLITPLLAGE